MCNQSSSYFHGPVDLLLRLRCILIETVDTEKLPLHYGGAFNMYSLFYLGISKLQFKHPSLWTEAVRISDWLG